MSVTYPAGDRPALTLAMPSDAEEPERDVLFPVDPELVVLSPWCLQAPLRAAALLWCTHFTFPGVSAIGQCADVKPSTILWPYGTIHELRSSLVTAERAALAMLVESHDGDLAAAVEERVAALCEHDERLSKLPLVAALDAGVTDAAELAVLAGAVRPVEDADLPGGLV